MIATLPSRVDRGERRLGGVAILHADV